MKILYKTISLVWLGLCLCMITSSPATAKVCFVGEEDCTGGGDFDEYKNPNEDGELCKKEGYIEKTSCQADMTKYIVSYCPYNSNYVMCCGREYSYNSCVYPLQSDGKCGNKFKCVCDPSKYKFKQQSAAVCQNTITGQRYENSRAAGSSCVYSGFANGQSTINAYFTECLCDRGLYPKTESECSSQGSKAAGNVCTDSNGNNYYSSCLCGDDYKVISSDCRYGTYIHDPLCQQGDIYKAKKCCECDDKIYPYYEEVDRTTVESYASCEQEKGCTRGNRFRALSCKPGYKVDAGKCVPKECDELLTDYFAERNIRDYEIYELGKAPSAKNVIIAKDIISSYPKNAEWSHFYNKKVISAAAYVQTITGSTSLVTLAKQQCTTTPVLAVSSIGPGITSPLDFTAISLGKEGSTSGASLYLQSATFTCTNCSINVFSFNIDSTSTVNLKRDTSLPNAGDLYVNAYNIIIKGNYNSEGYDYNVSPTYTSAGISVVNNFDKAVVFSGSSSNQSIEVKVGVLSTKGAALFKYANIYPYQTTIGSSSTSCSYPTEKTFLTLYYSALYLKPGATSSRNLYICAGAAIGYPDTSSDYSMSANYGSYIITSKNDYFGIRAYHDAYKSNGDCTYTFLNSNGKYSKANKCFFTERTTKHSHNLAGTTYKLTGDDNWSITVCKDNGHNCDGPSKCYRSNNQCAG